MRRIAILLCILILAGQSVHAEEVIEISAESGVIMEASSGKVLYEKNPDLELPPASVTKIMTLLLIFDALDEGKITLEEEVTTSEYAASMGGSQVFLEPGEKQTVETMIKCIAVASANDACVAMSEHICGSEEAFIKKMNDRADNLGMQHTYFVNCNGLDADGHLTTARDIAIMSRELLTKYPQITDYTTIWMEDIIHTTKKGSEKFGLSNTNRLIRQYEYATGLKTGSTSKAGFCLSASAKKDDIEMIAVVMNEPDSKTRVKDSITMLQYGFSKCNKYMDDKIVNESLYLSLEKGEKDQIEGTCKDPFIYVDTDGRDLTKVDKKIEKKMLVAPVKKDEIIGEIKYSIDGIEIGHIDIYAKENVERRNYIDSVKMVIEEMFS